MTAWLLDGSHDTTVFEAGPKLGGNLQTIEVDVRGQPAYVDVGPQYFHPGPYPRYSKLVRVLGLESDIYAAPSSISIFAAGEPNPRFVSPILPDRVWPLQEDWNRDGVDAFTTLTRQAIDDEAADHDWHETVDQFLGRLAVTLDQRDRILLPWIASIAGVDLAVTRTWSARAALVFLARATASLLETVQYQTLRHGMAGVLDAMVQGCTTMTAQLSSRVTAITRAADGTLQVVTGDRAMASFDEVVITAPAYAAVSLLAGLPDTEAQRAALQRIEWTDARLVIHRDGLYAPADPMMQSFLNCAVGAAVCEGSMRLADAMAPMPDGQPVDLWKSWASFRVAEPAQLVHTSEFRHVSITPQTHDAQIALRALSGQGNLWFAGGWTRAFDAQETCLLSALAVADGLGADSAHARALAADE